MPYNTNTSFPPGGNPVYRIDKDWCMGDSLGYINSNFQNLDTRVDTVSTNFVSLSSYIPTAPYSAKAWAVFDGTTTPPTIIRSYNIQNIVRNGDGDFTIILTRPTPNGVGIASGDNAYPGIGTWPLNLRYNELAQTATNTFSYITSLLYSNGGTGFFGWALAQVNFNYNTFVVY